MAATSDLPAGGLSLSRLARLARKELRETLRDRRTILTLVLMPLFVYPLLGLTFQKFLLSQAIVHHASGRPEYVLGFGSEADANRLKPLLEEADRILALRAARAGELVKDPPIFSAFWPEQGKADVPELVRRGAVDVGVLFGPGNRRGREGVELVFNPASSTGVAARREVEDRLRAVNEFYYRMALRQVGLTDPPPVVVTSNSIEATAGTAATIATVLPFVLLLMTVTGAVYPAIDLTAGERERGTLEALVAAPVSRRAVLAAKYVAVFTVAVITAGMNLIAMTVTAYALGLDKFLFGGGLNATAVSLVVALVLVMAAFFSAVLLFVTSFARSFKEAQAYLIPVMLVSLAPGIASLMPELRLSLPLAVTPLIGIVLLARDLLTGDASGLLVVACVGSTLLYAAVALLLAARAFGTDAVLYGSEGSWSELFHRPSESRDVPPLRAAMACLAAIVPAFLILGPLVARIESLTVMARLSANAVLLALLFFVLPTAVTILSRARLDTTFLLSRPRVLGLFGALLLGVSLWTFAYELQLLMLDADRIEALRDLFGPIGEQLARAPLWAKLLTLAVVPAVCEEWFFRGFLLSSLRTRTPDVLAVIATALLFGAFHVVVRDSLFFERIFATTFLGLVLGFVCVRTGSLWPGMLLHAVHNSLLLSLETFKEPLIRLGWSGGERTHLPWTWLAAALAIAALGAFLVWLAGRSSAAHQPAPK